MSKGGDAHVCCIKTICCQFIMCMFFAHECNMDWCCYASESRRRGGVKVRPWHWRVWCSSLEECYADARSYLMFRVPMCDLYLERYVRFHVWECMLNWKCFEKYGTKQDKEEGQQYHGVFVLWAGVDRWSDLWLFIDSLLKAAPPVVHKDQSGVIVSAVKFLGLYFSNHLVPMRCFDL